MSMKSKLSDNREEKGDHTTMIISGIPEIVKIEFKLYCVREGLSMSEVLVEAIRSILNNKNNL